KVYETVTTDRIPLLVRPGAATLAPAVAANPRAADSPPPIPDIISIKQRPGELTGMAAPLVQQPWFLGLQTVPLAAWLAVVGWRKRTEKLANNPRLQRRRQVDRLMREGIHQLQQLASENNSDDFFATLFRLLQERLGERLDLPAFAITEAVVEEKSL